MKEQIIELIHQVLTELRSVKEEVSVKLEDNERIDRVIDKLDGIEDRLDAIIDTFQDQEILR